MLKKIKDILRLYSTVEIIVQLIGLYTVNFYIFYLVSKSIEVSLIIGFIGMLFFFYSFSVRGRILNHYQEDLQNLMKYVTNMSFFLGTGENVYYALEATKLTVNDRIGKDIQRTIDIMESGARLDTEHFEKHDFQTLDQFHHNLQVLYEQGGNSRELFGTIQDSMVNELKKRDELYKRRKGFAMNVYIMLAMVGSTGLILRFMVSHLWDIFLTYQTLSIVVLIITYAMILTNLFFLQRQVSDISVQF